MAEDALVTTLLLAFFGACVLGPALGALVGWRLGFSAGAAVGALLIGLTGLAGAGYAAWHAWVVGSGSLSVQGRLIEFSEDRPVVEFTGPDGRLHRVTGLGGSQPRSRPGDAVAVQLPQGDPSHAVIDDLQNTQGVVIALALFGGLPTLFGVFFAAQAVSERRGPTPSARAPLPAQQHRRTRLTIVANVVFLGGFAVTFLGEDVIRSLGAGFMVVGTGCLLHFVAQSLPPAMPFHTRFIFVIVGVGFLAFGLLARLLGG